MGIRDATEQDLDAIVELGLEMHAESSYRDLRFDPGKVRSFMSGLIVTQYVRVYEKDGQLLGGMAGLITPTWFSDDLSATDIALMVSKEHRGSLIAVRLIKDFVRWATDRGATQIRPGVTTGAVGDAGARLYEALGFEAVGTTYVLNVR
jgi:GNAT superfamily N-acetyltransferase